MTQFKTLMLGVVLLKTLYQKQTIGRVGGGGGRWTTNSPYSICSRGAACFRLHLILRVWTTAWAGSGRIHTSHFCSSPSVQTGFSSWERLSTMSDGRRRKAWVSLKILQLESVLLSASCLLPASSRWYNHKTCFITVLADPIRSCVKDFTQKTMCVCNQEVLIHTHYSNKHIKQRQGEGKIQDFSDKNCVNRKKIYNSLH